MTIAYAQLHADRRTGGPPPGPSFPRSVSIVAPSLRLDRGAQTVQNASLNATMP